jgi:hypothetical protein
VRVGARTDAAGILASAFMSPAGDRLTLVVLNKGSSDTNLRVDPGAFAATHASAFRTVFRPGASETWTPIWQGSTDSLGGRSLDLPARSMATVVLVR